MPEDDAKTETALKKKNTYMESTLQIHFVQDRRYLSNLTDKAAKAPYSAASAARHLGTNNVKSTEHQPLDSSL